MHKYTSVQPISAIDVEHINAVCVAPLNEYCTAYLKQYSINTDATHHGGFAITYNEGHRGLALHTDDSSYTVNMCLGSSA